ncbi:MAG: NAD(P)H-hydrate dehydratase [Gemmatimonadota bacterium]|jgi:NAD(P)H-hydrate epimerase|nr:NAD(P)H-hydrate dehydratase [Gemmatimonadota bacterium]
MIPVFTAAEMRDREKRIFASGVADEALVMEAAGRAVAAVVSESWSTGLVAAAVGAGKNGGDAIIALRTLAALGREVIAVPVGREGIPEELTLGWPIPLGDISSFRSAAVIIDGILGTGASGAPREAHAEAIRAINAAGVPVVSVDGPSGLDLTTGTISGDVIRAAVTVTFGALKRGLLTGRGREQAGRIQLAGVGFPPFEEVDTVAITNQWAHVHLPRISPDAHKGSVGLVAIVAGGKGFGGAAVLTAMGALRAGAGGVRIFSAGENRVVLNTAVPEAVFINRESDEVARAAAGARAAVIGPGIGTDDDGLRCLTRFLEHFEGSFVLDADALTLLARNPELLTPTMAGRCVMTPHPGELARLLGAPIAEVLRDRFASARLAAEQFGCVILAKGTPSLTVSPTGFTIVNLTGHAGVATAGMGDTLAGIVGTFLAGGMTPRDAAAVGIHFAGRAAEVAGRGRGLLPRDVAEALPGVLLFPLRDEPESPPHPLVLEPPRG